MKTFLEKLMVYYGVDLKGYDAISKESQIEDIPSYDSLLNIDFISKRINSAIKDKEKIVIYGDYDADGVLATSILIKTFKKLNVNVNYYIPSRYLDGYGLNVEMIHRFKEKGYSLIITVDNGISQYDAIDEAKKLGIDVIVTDHHESGSVLPSAYAILHPLISNYGKVITSGAYIAFMLASKLLNYYDDYLLSLAAISTVSDMMPLLSYNRDIVKIGMRLMNENNFLPLSFLADFLPIDENIIASRIAPRINAIGRVIENTNINRLVKFFTSDDENEIRELGYWIKSVNEQRKDITKTVVENLQEVDTNEHAIVQIVDSKEGLIGLIANRLLNEYKKPTVVFCADTNDKSLLRGSARSKTGFSVIKAFSSLQELVGVAGGHALAGGLTIKAKDFITFKERFEQLAASYPIVEEEKGSIEISLNDITWENYSVLRSFAPFGMDFPSPVFVLKGIKVSNLTFVSGGKHIITSLSKNVKLVSFNSPKEQFNDINFIDVIGSFDLNYYKNYKTLQFNIISYKKSSME